MWKSSSEAGLCSLKSCGTKIILYLLPLKKLISVYEKCSRKIITLFIGLKHGLSQAFVGDSVKFDYNGINCFQFI